MNGLRIGTPELVRWGVTPDHASQLAALIAKALYSDAPESLASDVRRLRETFQDLHYMTL